MADSLRDLVVSLSLNTDNFTRNIKSVNKQIQEAESYFKLASAGVQGFDSSTAGLSSKLEMLERKLSLQKDAVGQYEKALQAASEKLTECYNRQQDYSSRLADAKAKQNDLAMEVQVATIQYEHYRDTLGETNSATIAAKQNMEAAQQEYAEATAEVEKLAGQNDALQRSTQNAADAVSTAHSQLNKAQAAVKETEAAIKQTNQELKTAQSAWTAAGKALEDFSKKAEKVGKSATQIGKSLTTTFTTPILGLATGAVKASVEFESAFAGVRKTVDASEAEFDELAGSIKQMSTEVAASTTDIASVVETAGQLGIENSHLMEFARTMIDLGNSTNMQADEAASQAARFANIMGMSQSQFQNLGSTLVDLGNNYATTESEIMAMSLRLAGAGKQVGLSEAEILGFAAALSSVGIEAQMGGSAFSKALVKMEVAAATGGEALDDFAKVSGMTSAQFKNIWENDPAAAFHAFITGLSRMDEQGVSAIATLNDIGISEIRLRDTLLRATNATELFSKTQVTAKNAWKQNTALTTEANKRYATTESRLTNLKNKAVLFAQTIGSDLAPMINQIIDGVGKVIERFSSMDASTRQQIIRIAGIAAAIGPAILVFGKLSTGVGKVTSVIGTFATAVGKAGGGFSGFMSILSKSPAVWLAVAAAVVVGTVALADYLSGAKATREALKGLQETAENWKNTAAETFYGKSEGLSFFGMSKDDFVKRAEEEKQTAAQWMSGMIAVWSDGKRETNDIVKQWQDSWKSLTGTTRDGLTSLKATADKNGYTSLSSQMGADLKQLDSIDKEMTSLLKRRQNKKLSDKDKVRIQELIDTRNAIMVKYKLVPESEDVGGFDTLQKKFDAEVARAEARGQQVTIATYENAIVGAAQGLAAINSQLDEQYDAEYALIQLMTNEAEKQKALTDLNARYNQNRKNAAMEYATFLQGVVGPVWEKDSIQQAKTQVTDLFQLLRKYSAASKDERDKMLPDLNQLTKGMDEGAIAEYIGLLTQVQSLLDSGFSEAEVSSMFPDIDFSSALEQLASIQTFLNNNSWDSNLDSLNTMFGDALGEEVLKIATDLDMTGAQARWEEWATNPGSITTDAIVESYAEAENIAKLQPKVDAFVEKYTEVKEGADKASLTPSGLLAYVATYAEATTGTDVSSLNPSNITAMVAAYKELAAGADVSTLKPSEITAYIMQYLEKKGVDTSKLSPDAVTAFVMAYEELTGGASTTALTPSNITAMVVKYAEAEGIDLSALSPDQITALVNTFAEATGCDKSSLMQNFVAYIAEYKEAAGVKKPTLNISVGLTGYDLLSYRRFVKNNKVTVDGIVKLSELYQDPSEALGEENVKFWKDGIEIPAKAVTTEMLKPSDLAVLDTDGTMHILITTEVTGAPEAIEDMREQVTEVDQLGMTAIGTAFTGIMPASLMDFISSAEERIKTAKERIGSWNSFLYGGEEGIMRTLDQSMQYDFSPDRIAQLSTYVAEVVSAIQQGNAVSQEDMDNLNTILQFVQDLDTAGVGSNVTQGIAEGMVSVGWDGSAETLANNLEAAINAALVINSPSARMMPAGQYVAQGIGEGMTGTDMSSYASTLASAIETAASGVLTSSMLSSYGITVASGLASAMSGYSFSSSAGTIGSKVRSAASSSLTSATLRTVGINAMNGLAAGIRSGQNAVVSAMRTAAKKAVQTAKSELKISSPSRVFRDEVGVMTMKGLGEGVTREATRQAKVISNAARYLTDAAHDGAIGYTHSDNSRTYNSTSSVNFSGSSFYIRDEQDVRSLAIEIATLTKRQQRGKGLRMA